SFSNETPSNGGRINLGYEGNTAEASRTRAQNIQLISPNGFEKFHLADDVIISWTSSGLGAFVTIEASYDGGASFNPIATTSNDGNYAWNPDTFTTQGLIRVSDALDPTISDVSNSFFTVGESGHEYFVNDNSTATSFYGMAFGNNANSGTTAADPVASLNAILSAYDLGPGDIIYMDDGIYQEPVNVRITQEDEGVTIQGPLTPTPLGGDYQNRVLEDAPVAYWRLGESSGTTAADSSPNLHDATYLNGAVLGQGGAINGNSNTSVRLDGVNDFIQLPSGFADMSNGITMEAWVNPANQGNFARIFNLGNGQGNDLILVGRYSTTVDTLFVQTYNGTSAGTVLTFANVLDQSHWTHIAVSITSAGNVLVYKNGRLIGSGASAPLRNVTRTSNFIGKSDSPTDAYWSGGIDEAAIYDKVLSADRISTHYLAATTSGAVLNRGNVTAGSYALELNNADGITLTDLGITGAYEGVFVNNGSSQLTVQNSILFDNANAGLNITDAASSTPIIRD
ncbi:MAG TPA: LamG domain-containing protein, partial [Tepidisphaeraceae bacterium]|nr:LamG domain-containing protein [Tepidisphaeraceae bacterium]